MTSMLTAGSIMSPIECAICLEYFNATSNVPASFPCGHSCCCLKHTLDMRICHVCRAELPKHLSPNIALRDLAVEWALAGRLSIDAAKASASSQAQSPAAPSGADGVPPQQAKKKKSRKKKRKKKKSKQAAAPSAEEGEEELLSSQDEDSEDEEPEEEEEEEEWSDMGSSGDSELEYIRQHPGGRWELAVPPPFYFHSLVRPMHGLPDVGKQNNAQFDDDERFIEQMNKRQGWMFAGEIQPGIGIKQENLFEIRAKDTEGTDCKVILDFQRDPPGKSDRVLSTLKPGHTLCIAMALRHIHEDGRQLVFTTTSDTLRVVPLNMDEFLKLDFMAIVPFKWCHHCHKPRKKLFQCQRCGTRYCTRHCQMADWPTHKKFCKAWPFFASALDKCAEECAAMMRRQQEAQEAMLNKGKGKGKGKKKSGK